MGKRGPKTFYDIRLHPILAETFAREGSTFEEIAGRMKVGITTLREWVKQYPEMAQAVKETREVADGNVAKSLFQRAMGYEYEETEIVRDRHGDKVRKIKKRMAPDVTAQIFWLKNRRPDLWRDVQKYEHSGVNGAPIKSEVSIVELAKCAKEFDEFSRRQMGRELLPADSN